jgi:hypothetical protein
MVIYLRGIKFLDKMNLKLTLEIDNSAEKKAKSIIELSQKITYFFKDKSYGDDLEEVSIGIICIKTKIGYEEWYKLRKPKYISYKKTKNKLTGVEYIVSKSFSYDIKIDNELYNSFIDSNELDGLKILAREILNSFSNFNSLPKKEVKEFDKDKFYTDLESFFDKEGIY